jgi:hypothetical protein
MTNIQGCCAVLHGILQLGILTGTGIGLSARNIEAAWGVNVVALKNPQYFFIRPSNNIRYRSCESLFFPLNINMSLLMPSVDRNAVLIH